MKRRNLLKSKLSKAILLGLTCLLIITGISCQRAVIQTGEVDKDATIEDLNISGTIQFNDNPASGTDADMMAGRAIARAFQEAFPDVKVIYSAPSVSDYPTRISSGDIGDVFWCDTADVYNFQRNHNALMPLDAYIKPMGIDTGDVYSGVIDGGKIGGKLYMAARNIGEHILIYNETMLTAEGISFDNSEAVSWDEFKAICRQLMKYDETGTRLVQTGASMKIWWHPVYQYFFRGWGGEWVDSVNHQIHIVDSNEVMQGIEELVNACIEGFIYPEDISGSISGSLKDLISQIPDGTGNVSYVGFKTFGDLSWIVSYGNTYDQMGIDWDFCPFPALPHHTVSTGCTGYVVYNRTKNPDAAAAFALFFLTEAGQRAYHSSSGGNVPLLRSLSDETFWRGLGNSWPDKNYTAFVMYPDITRPVSLATMMPTDISTMFSSTVMQQTFANILSGRTDIQNAFNSLQTKANEKWKTLMD